MSVQMSVQNDCTDVIVQVLFLRLVTMDCVSSIMTACCDRPRPNSRSPSSRKHAVLARVESTESASARRPTTRTLLVSISACESTDSECTTYDRKHSLHEHEMHARASATLSVQLFKSSSFSQ